MKVRSIDVNGDWNLGNGKGDYKINNSAIAQNIRTRLGSFLGDCFFDLNSGLDWFTLLGSKDMLSLRLSVSSVILNTDGVTGLLGVNTVLDNKRNFTLQYKVQTVYSTITDNYQFSVGI